MYNAHLCVRCCVFERARVEIRSSLCGIYAEACFRGQSRAVRPDVLRGPRAARSAADFTTGRTRQYVSCVIGTVAKAECKISFSPATVFWTFFLEVLCSKTGQGTSRRD